MMYFLLNERVMNGDGLMVASRLAKKVAIVGFVNGKFGIIYKEGMVNGTRDIMGETYIQACLVRRRNVRHPKCDRTCCDRSS